MNLTIFFLLTVLRFLNMDFNYVNFGHEMLATMLLSQHVRVIVSVAIVLHNAAIPSLGIPGDAIPRRLNHTSMFTKREEG
jgi:hypothetical protein